MCTPDRFLATAHYVTQSYGILEKNRKNAFRAIFGKIINQNSFELYLGIQYKTDLILCQFYNHK